MKAVSADGRNDRGGVLEVEIRGDGVRDGACDAGAVQN